MEIDDSDQVRREIGFNAAVEPITAAPLGENWGISTDSDGAPVPLGLWVDPNDFEKVFSQVCSGGGGHHDAVGEGL